MDTSGRIREFASLQEAEHEGFKTALLEAEAKQLLKHPEGDRHAELLALRHRRFVEAQGHAAQLSERQRNRNRAKAARKARRKNRGRK